ncbi:MAG: class I SAM-dependent methyltransferase [Campylobacterales bacterium]|nr:class I SAM-dependent methyltransferase [Campylobacterales bacterium]MBN2832917.1 class I SAM-dependent methyltransferase [Campylobacterales bacterium]
MAHIQQQEFCQRVREKYKDFFRHKFILDIGSLDINGNNQEYFYNCNYIGVDIALGRNVDVISKGHELKFPEETFDVIISTECFEHDQYYYATINNIYRMLKPGGLFLFTCATTGRAEHGTRRTTPEDAPLLQSDIEWSDYYKNLTELDIRKVLDIEKSFSMFEFSTNEISQDLYFYGFKQGQYLERHDYSFLLKDKPEAMRYYCQIFVDEGNGFFEELSTKISIEKDLEIKHISFDLSQYNKINGLRFDPLNDACVVCFTGIKAILTTDEELDLTSNISSNACFFDGYNYFFNTNDSQIYFDKETLKEIKELRIFIKYPFTGREALQECINQRDHQLNLVLKSKENIENELEIIYDSRSWKLIKKLKAFSNLFKKHN